MELTAALPKAVASGIDEIEALKGKLIGPSDWREVTQQMINEFADLSDDHQWIHVDV
ncbi:MAG TPA: MaoC/PaaZ C-terminal domain-containing protein [Solirubrobacteraceae bacterium]|nr:MaoC/PaaZ C-terminal domain-containing protein [Solirubrobacteraceae bacterium]